MAKSKTPSSMTETELRGQLEDLRRQLKEIEKVEKKKEERREKLEYRLFDSFLDKIKDPVFIYDAVTYNIVHCNEAFMANYGYSREEARGLTPFDLYRPEDFGRVREMINEPPADKAEIITHLTKDRSRRTVEIKTAEIHYEGNPAFVCTVHDITERRMMVEELQSYRDRLEEMVDERTLEVLVANKKLREEIEEREKAQTAILESETKFRNLIEKSLDGIILVDETGAIIEWNRGQETIYGVKRPLVMGKKIWDVQFQYEPKEKREAQHYLHIKRLWENFFKTGINPFEKKRQLSKIERPDGKLIDILQLYFTIETDHGTMMACTTRDITSELVMEKQFTQSQKMEAMGILAGGIAHDFNNLLGGIMGYTELALRKTDEKAASRKYLDQVLSASKRAAELVKQILTFSRSEKKQKEPVKIGLIVKEAVKLLRSSLSDNIEIISKIEDDDNFVLADPTQIHQVIMNLCTNAGHAMKKKGGIMEVRLSKVMIEAGLYKELEAGPHIRLSVSDTGKGIPPELLDQIFDPFFTTKVAGEGTGMGLAVVHGIITSYNGNISVYSKVGEGTAFSVLLPVLKEVIDKEDEKETDIPGGKERILLVEDDISLAEAEKKLLQELGYGVTVMNNGVEALEIFRKLPDRFDIIITDHSMPRMTGIELIRSIRAGGSDIPVIICTGLSKVIPEAGNPLLGIGEIVMKPLKLGYIARTIRRLLDEEPNNEDKKTDGEDKK